MVHVIDHNQRSPTQEQRGDGLTPLVVVSGLLHWTSGPASSKDGDDIGEQALTRPLLWASGCRPDAPGERPRCQSREGRAKCHEQGCPAPLAESAPHAGHCPLHRRAPIPHTPEAVVAAWPP